jgi:predicted ATP-dependent serine protease
LILLQKKIATKTGLELYIVKALITKAERIPRKVSGFQTGAEIEAKEEATLRVKTGISLIDQHIGGGFLSGSVIEIFGPQWGGKTVICIQIAVMNQSLGNVVWYDLEGTFAEDTVREIAYRMKLEPESVLEKFHIVQDMSSENLVADLRRVVTKDDVNLIVIDSLVKVQHRDIPQIAQIKRDSEMTFLLTNRSSIQVSRASEKDRKSRSSNPVFADMVDYRIMIEPRTENERRVVVMSSASVERGEWIVSLGYGGFYQNNRSLKLHSRRVQRYLRRLRGHKLL